MNFNVWRQTAASEGRGISEIRIAAKNALANRMDESLMEAGYAARHLKRQSRQDRQRNCPVLCGPLIESVRDQVGFAEPERQGKDAVSTGRCNT